MDRCMHGWMDGCIHAWIDGGKNAHLIWHVEIYTYSYTLDACMYLFVCIH
jgi:hypothetical protein